MKADSTENSSDKECQGKVDEEDAESRFSVGADDTRNGSGKAPDLNKSVETEARFRKVLPRITLKKRRAIHIQTKNQGQSKPVFVWPFEPSNSFGVGKLTNMVKTWTASENDEKLNNVPQSNPCQPGEENTLIQIFQQDDHAELEKNLEQDISRGNSDVLIYPVHKPIRAKDLIIQKESISKRRISISDPSIRVSKNSFESLPTYTRSDYRANHPLKVRTSTNSLRDRFQSFFVRKGSPDRKNELFQSLNEDSYKSGLNNALQTDKDSIGTIEVGPMACGSSSSMLKLSSESIDRTDWLAQCIRNCANIAIVRERCYPLFRATSFANMFNSGVDRVVINTSEIIQLVMQYFDYEGLHDVLETLEFESKITFDTKVTLHELQDARLVTLLMIVLKNTDDLWSTAICYKNFETLNTERQGSGTLIASHRTTTRLNSILSSFKLIAIEPSPRHLDIASDDVNIWEEPMDGNLILDQNTGQIVAGTLNKLIQLLTPRLDVDFYYTDAFLTTYQLFCTSNMLFRKLVQRYNVPYMAGIPQHRYKSFCMPFQVRVINILKKWIEEFYTDFDHNLLNDFHEFCITCIKPSYPKYAYLLLKLIEERSSKVSSRSFSTVFTYSEEPPRPILPKNIFWPNLTIDDIDEEEIARQLTLIEFEGFYKIQGSELLHQSWNKPKLKHRAPHVLEVIERFNSISEWVATKMLLVKKLKDRVKTLSRLINIADHLKKMRNYSTLMAYLAAFRSTPIERLKRTFDELQPKTKETLANLLEFMNVNDQYSTYLRELENPKLPCIPFLGLYLTELTYAEESAESSKQGLINFSKCRTIYKIIAQIRTFQQTGYNFLHIYQVQKTFNQFQPRYSEKEMYNMSWLIESRL
ncbi:ras guanine nucleotide exchange factor A-like [Schistocerca gregaria]|uniref:ras guanine nucleotide exchange factor A-like n=1 Tax=Schistocerca gregaria TaxID=7010 RepID=UPI00211E34B9|nr:ras guanine nucleotide exchange factor A-like [Schistocerca gregaria]